jgi:anti-sigma B factor antagonist
MTPDNDTATGDLEITLEFGESRTIVRLRGCFNIDSSPAVRNQLLLLLRAQSPEPLIVDLTDVTYIDSSGIATLIEGLKSARMRQTRLSVQGLQGRLLHLFQVTGMSALFDESGYESTSSVSQVS